MKPTSALPFLLPLVAAMPPPDRLPLADVSRDTISGFNKLETSSANFQPNKRPIAALGARGLGDMTQNDVKNGACKKVTVLFARGTTEQGNMGTLAGPPFVQAVGAAVGADNVAVQGIDYPADIPGFLAGGDAGGSKQMAQFVQQVKSACPTTSLVMAGYSQGGQLVHNAAGMLSAADSSFVKSAVIFGDPDNGKAVGSVPAAKTKVICHQGDLICAGQAVVLAPHLTYSMNAGEAAAFVASSTGAGK